MKKIIKKAYMFLAAFVFAAAFSGCGADSPVFLDAEVQAQTSVADVPESTQGAQDTASEQDAQDGNCFVYICGAVRRPGVYEMHPGSRIYEVIARAGGFAKGAARDCINQAQQVTDGQMIEIATKADQKASAAQKTEDALVNINTASEQELMTLSGIGQAKAAQIIAYRSEHGNFTAPEQLMDVSGIGAGVYAKIQDKITVIP